MANSRIVDRIRIGFSPLSGKLYLYRHGKDPAVALEKRECEADVMNAFREYMMHDAPRGATMEFHLGGDWFRVSCEPIAAPTAADPPQGGRR